MPPHNHPQELDNTTVTKLIAATCNGDSSAFEQLILAHQNIVWSTLNRGIIPRAEVEDLAQDTFMDAYRGLSTFDGESPFGAWIRGIARNKLRMHLRTKSRAARHLHGYQQEITRQIEGEEKGNSNDDDLLAALRRCQERLSGDAQTVVHLRYQDGQDFEYIAQQIGRTVQATRRLLSRVRSELRNCIDSKVAST